MNIYWGKTGGAWIATNIKNNNRGNPTKDKPDPIFKIEELSIKLRRICFVLRLMKLQFVNF